MLKRFLISLVILSITGSAYVSASSYLDKQIKQNKASQKYNNIDKATASYSSDFLSSKNVGINLKDPKPGVSYYMVAANNSFFFSKLHLYYE